jgi:2-keto-3-deoxy-L-rhamnonate aldolase RhmA
MNCVGSSHRTAAKPHPTPRAARGDAVIEPILRNAARERLDAGELALGVGIRQSRTADIASMMKASGYDWLFLDLEHNAMVVMLETPRPIENAAATAAVPGIAGVYDDALSRC